MADDRGKKLEARNKKTEGWHGFCIYKSQKQEVRWQKIEARSKKQERRGELWRRF